jgi:hypothetical protein
LAQACRFRRIDDLIAKNAEICTVEPSTENLPEGRPVNSRPVLSMRTASASKELLDGNVLRHACLRRPGDFAHDPTSDLAYAVESRQRCRTGSRRGYTTPQSRRAPECFPGTLPSGDGVVRGWPEGAKSVSATAAMRATRSGEPHLRNSVDGPNDRAPVVSTGRFRMASTECYHQQYLAKNPDRYCELKGTRITCPTGGSVVVPTH